MIIHICTERDKLYIYISNIYTHLNVYSYMTLAIENILVLHNPAGREISESIFISASPIAPSGPPVFSARR